MSAVLPLIGEPHWTTPGNLSQALIGRFHSSTNGSSARLLGACSGGVGAFSPLASGSLAVVDGGGPGPSPPTLYLPVSKIRTNSKFGVPRLLRPHPVAGVLTPTSLKALRPQEKYPTHCHRARRRVSTSPARGRLLWAAVG